MNDLELDAMVASAARVSDAEVDALALSGSETDLCEAIMSTIVEAGIEPTEASTRDLRRKQHRRPGLRRVAAIAAAAALIVGALVVFQGGSSTKESAWAARAVEVASAAPRVLVTGDGWEITDVSGFDETNGEVTFSDGQVSVELFWRSGRTHDGNLNDRAHDGVSLGTMQVAGYDAQVFEGTPLSFNVLWKQGNKSVELMVGGAERHALEELLERVREVDVDTWLSAMPPWVVKPVDRAATIDGMLADIPVPRGFNVDGLRSADNPGLGRGDLGFFVTRAVACSWLAQWLAASDSGDRAGANEAVEAMHSSRDWPILKEMNAIGGWLPTRVQQIWKFADALERGFAVDGAGLRRPVREVYAPDGPCNVAL